jgi:hypothetical protein
MSTGIAPTSLADGTVDTARQPTIDRAPGDGLRRLQSAIELAAQATREAEDSTAAIHQFLLS